MTDKSKVVVDGDKVELVKPGEGKQLLRVKKTKRGSFMPEMEEETSKKKRKLPLIKIRKGLR